MSEKSKIQFDYELKTSSTLGGSYTAVCKLRMLSTPGMEAGTINVSELDDEWDELLVGRKKLNECSFEALVNATNVAALFTLFDRDPGEDNLFYMIEWPLETAQSTPRSIKFAGILNRINQQDITVESTEAARLPFTIQPSGAPTLTAAT